MSDDLSKPSVNRSRRIKIASFAIATSVAALCCFFVILSDRTGRDYREGYAKAKCTSNLHQIGLGILLYCGDYGGQYPDSLAKLLTNEQLQPYVFICPGSGDEASTAPTTQTQAQDLANPGRSSYIYLGKGLNDKTVLPDQVIAYEPLKNHGDGMCVLCGDGHSEFVPVPRANQILKAAATTQTVTFPP